MSNLSSRRSLCRYALVGAAAALLAGCSGSQPPIGAPGAMPQAAASAMLVERDGSWMLPEAKSQDLVYLSAPFSNNVYIFALRSGKVVGMIGGLNRPVGDCSDKRGNVYVTNTLSNEILEYAHGGTTPVATLADPAGTPSACSVDESTGSLAVGDYYNSVSVYSKGTYPPTTYSDYDMTYISSVAYDNAGNLFVDGLYGNGYFRMAELPKGSSLFTTISLNERVYAGAIQWDGRYLAVTSGGTNNIYRVRISGSIGAVVATVAIRAGKCFGALSSDWIQGNTIIAPYRPRCGHIGVWKYPLGGAPIEKFGKIHEGFDGVTVSVGE